MIAEPVVPLPSSREVAGHDLQGRDPGAARALRVTGPAERRPAKKTPGGAARDSGRARRLFLLVGGAVLLLALAGAWFLLQNRERLFPNSQESGSHASGGDREAGERTPSARAERLHKAGRTTTALSQLKRIPPNDPHYAKAQALIAQWSGGTAPGDPAAVGAAGPGTAPAGRRAGALDPGGHRPPRGAARRGPAGFRAEQLPQGPRPAGAGGRARQARRRRRPAPRRHPQTAGSRWPTRSTCSASTNGSTSSPISGACTMPIRPTATSPS